MAPQVKDLALSLRWLGLLLVGRVWSLAWEFPHVMGMPKKKKSTMHYQQILENSLITPASIHRNLPTSQYFVETISKPLFYLTL